jgi:hypothetical protein
MKGGGLIAWALTEEDLRVIIYIFFAYRGSSHRRKSTA